MTTHNFYTGKEASNKLGVHQRTLQRWENKELIEVIRTPGGKRLYNVDKYIKDKLTEEEKEEYETRLKLAYIRVSTVGQKDDLERQKQRMKELYPDHILIEDIGSGLKLTKRGIKKIIHLAIEGKVEEVVVFHKDRLARFGFDLIEDLIKEYSGGRIFIIEEKENIEPEEELVKDVIQVMNVFTAKMNDLRKYKKKMKNIENT
jgi:putative resolvase